MHNRKPPTLLALLGLLAALAVAGPAEAGGPEDLHSKNIEQLAQHPLEINKKLDGEGSDIAFQEDLLVAGSYDGLGLFRILKDKPYLRQLSFFDCPASQGDVSVHGDYVFISIDSAGSNDRQSNVCNNTDQSQNKEGIRIVDISNPEQPRQVKFVATECGSHTHSLLPDGNTVYLYIESYPIVQEPTCNVASHRKISVVEVALENVAKAKVVSTPSVSPAIGCHDVTFFPSKKIAAAACISESQIWDIKDPKQPKIVSHIYNPFFQVHHSAGITWDGKYAVLGDEFAGSITGQCGGNQDSPIGAMWFYDISDPDSPQVAGYYNVPRAPAPQSAEEVAYMACTTHNFNILPMKDAKRYVAVSGYRAAGLSVVDFSDPSSPKELAHYVQLKGGKIPDVWAAYWYNGRIYTNDNAAERGISVYELEGTGAKDVHFFKDRLNPQTQIPDFK